MKRWLLGRNPVMFLAGLVGAEVVVCVVTQRGPHPVWLALAVLAAWRAAHHLVMENRGRVHKERSFMVAGTLYVGPETYKPVVVSPACKAETGW